MTPANNPCIKKISCCVVACCLCCIIVAGCNARHAPQVSVLDLKAEAARDKIAAGRRVAQGQEAQERSRQQLVVERILAAAEDFMGTRYSYGGTSASGFDCSGFVQCVFGKLDYDLPHSSRSQAQLGTPVDREDLQPGDLVFFDIRRSGRISHVGIYIGNGDVLHASVHTGVTIDNLSEEYYRVRYAAARRILRPEDQFVDISFSSVELWLAGS